jgi:hypothetical protein
MLDQALRNIVSLAGGDPGDSISSPIDRKSAPASPTRKGSAPANDSSYYLESESDVPTTYIETPSGKACVVAWEMFKRYYLRILFPGTARRVGMVVDDREGFPTCPPKILFTLVDLIVRYLSHYSYLSRHCLPSFSSGRLLNSAIVLNLVIFGNFQSRELIHEIIRQSLLLPFSEIETIKGGIHAIRSWISMNVYIRILINI